MWCLLKIMFHWTSVRHIVFSCFLASLLSHLCPQRCTEPWNHIPWAPEADPGCHPDPPSPGHPNARPRRSGLTNRGTRRVSHCCCRPTCYVQMDDGVEKRREQERKRERVRQRFQNRRIDEQMFPLSTPTLPHASLSSLLPFYFYKSPQRQVLLLLLLVRRMAEIICDLYLRSSNGLHLTGSGSVRNRKNKKQRCQGTAGSAWSWSLRCGSGHCKLCCKVTK